MPIVEAFENEEETDADRQSQANQDKKVEIKSERGTEADESLVKKKDSDEESEEGSDDDDDDEDDEDGKKKKKKKGKKGKKGKGEDDDDEDKSS